MTITLHNLKPNPGATKKRKRVGRGPGSGRGKTSVRGQKGQKSRSGSHGARVGFEGGQMPLQRRLPKRGFKNPFRVEAFAVNVGVLEERFEAGDISLDALRASGLVPKRAKLVKVLGSGDLTKKFTVEAHRFSKSALAKIEAAGGAASVVSTKKSEAESAPTPTETPTEPPTDTPTDTSTDN